MIKVLGASGSLDKNHGCTAFQLNDHILIDAGNVMQQLGSKSLLIEHVFLTHAHFDHITDLPFLIEDHFEERRKPLKVYGLKETLETLKNHIFNHVVWPKFHQILHPVLQTPLLEFVEIEYGQNVVVEGFDFSPFETNHTVACCGYIIKNQGVGCLISGDTYLNPRLVELINQDPSIQSLIIETSFPSRLKVLAEQSKHLTTDLLKDVLKAITRPLKIYLYHLKPAYEVEILAELKHPEIEPKISKVLQLGDQVNVFTQPKMISVQSSPDIRSIDWDEQQLKSLLNIAQALSAETNSDKLLEMILEQAMSFSHADAGTLYRITEDQNELAFTVIRNRSLDIKMGGTAEAIRWNNLPLYQEDGVPNTKMVAALCALERRPIAVDEVYESNEFDFTGTKKIDQSTGYKSVSMLVVPLLDRDQRLLGVLQLINKQDAHGHAIPFTESDQENTMALASQAAISLANTLLIQQLDTLFEAFINTIAKALDEKCSFTGGHVQQVAKLTMLLANAINEDQGVYKDVSYTQQELHTLKIAALLHDVGKIATPEFIMQKATKLEKVYDRLETVRHRIEILKRDVEIEALQQQLKQDGIDLSGFYKTLTSSDQGAQIQELDETFEFLKSANTGDEFLLDEAVDKIKQIATLNYQIGGQTQPLLQDEEVMNLCIQRGTLNQEEREKIMDHARVSLEILQTLPFPDKYSRVVDIAVNHHEKLDGSGYPRGLDANQLTLEDRILILADLYEALSAQDRPYKAPHPLSKISRILSALVNSGAIDKKLVKFFFESGAYKKYNCFLKPSQIDEPQLNID